jgi:hypothetical protein
VLDTHFYALANDPAAGHPDATIVADEAALQAIFREQYEANIHALSEPVKAKSGLGKGMIWGTAADRSVITILNAARSLEQTDSCEATIAAFVHAEGSPLKGKADMMWVTHEDQCQPYLKRGACCLWYTASDAPDDYCSTCPLRPVEERVEMLRSYMAEKT